MDPNRMKKAAQWFYSTVFREEAILPKPTPPADKLPSALRAARSLENDPAHPWQSRESIFIKQGKFLVNYEDDYDFQGNVVRYFPTYQVLSDPELRGYFSWRTRLRKGDVQKTSLSFAFLYIYELLNQIGVSDPMEGYEKLAAFRESYGALDGSILSYLDRWMTDYVVYYGLDPQLLKNSGQVLLDTSIGILDEIQEQEDGRIMEAVRHLAPKWLSRSKFYAANPADFDRVMVRVLRRVHRHYATRTKRTMVEQFFGTCQPYQVTLFATAVFFDAMKQQNRECTVDPRCVYRCQNGFWTVTRHPFSPGSNRKLEDILKTADAVFREEYAYKHPVKCATDTKWLIKLIREEVQALLAEKKAAEARKLTIDYSQLSKIRREAAITQEKLTVEEEEEAPAQEVIPEAPPPQDCPLSEPEYRLLHSLLYGEGIDWVHSQGYMLSVLVDGINEKLYDTFLDSVLDDTPALMEDYIEDLKEMITP